MDDYFNKLLNAIKSSIQAEIPEFIDVGIFGGGFNGTRDVKKFTSIAPSLRVALVGLNKSLNLNSNQLETELDLSLIFITKDVKVANSKHAIALSFLERVLLLVKNGNWGIENLYATDINSVNAHNYWGEELMQSDIALWQVNWKQKCVLGIDRENEKTQ